MKKIIRAEKNGVKYTNKAGFDKRKIKAKQDNLKGYVQDLHKGEKPGIRTKLFS